MPPQIIFSVHLVLGYVAWLLCFWIYIRPRLKAMPWADAQRAIAALHSFRFFGLAFVLPGAVGNLPAGFAGYAAYGDLATGVLAMLALATASQPAWFRLFVIAFNLTGTVDLLGDYYHAVQLDLPARAGELGAMYAIPVLYVPLLMITHGAAFSLLLRAPQRMDAHPRAVSAGAGAAR